MSKMKFTYSTVPILLLIAAISFLDNKTYRVAITLIACVGVGLFDYLSIKKMSIELIAEQTVLSKNIYQK